MGLKLCMEFVLAGFFLPLVSKALLIHNPRGQTIAAYELRLVVGTHCFVPLKQHNSPAFVACRKVISSVVEFDGRDDVRL